MNSPTSGNFKHKAKRFVFLLHPRWNRCLRLGRNSYRHGGTCGPSALLTSSVYCVFSRSAHRPRKKLSQDVKRTGKGTKRYSLHLPARLAPSRHLRPSSRPSPGSLAAGRDLITGIRSGRLDGGHAKSH